MDPNPDPATQINVDLDQKACIYLCCDGGLMVYDAHDACADFGA
jgi:hypothetical protein